MFLTRSIRRKLVIGLGLVCLMLLLLGFVGVATLMSYRTLVRELEYSLNQHPRRTELSTACATLFDPLLGERTPAMPVKDRIQPNGPEVNRTRLEEGVEIGEQLLKFADAPPPPWLNTGATITVGEQLLSFDSEKWDEARQLAHDELKQFRSRVYRLPTTPELVVIQSIMLGKVQQVSDTLGFLDQRRESLETAEDPQPILNAMIRDVSRIQTIIKQIPNPDYGSESSLREAPTILRYRMWMMCGGIVAIPILLFSLVRCGHFWVFVPIRKLHEAASRVANGDYNFRLKLRGRDEMVDLANVFNRMVERFQSDKAKLDHEVEERSRQLLRNERLAGIGFLATGIAHEINNPLSAIAMAAESLMGRLKEAGDQFGTTHDDRELLQTYLDMIHRQSFRCQQITTRVLDFSRNSSAPRQRHDLTRIVTEVMDMVGHMSRFEHHRIVFDRSRSHFVEVNAPEIQQVIINLVANGLEAMETAGTLTIGIAESLEEVVLTVEDTGCGMTPHVLANLYEPFFTEKLPGKKGTGLGLSITNRIIAEHHGRIEASSDGPGKGSTFRVHLPRNAGVMSRAA